MAVHLQALRHFYFVFPLVIMMTQDLLQDLVQSVHLSPASKILPLNQETVHEVVFESKVDGISYYLVRCQPTPKQLVSLSPREQAIAQLIAQGHPINV